MNLKNKKYILMGNGGDGTIALLQWAMETSLQSYCFVSIDTGFAHSSWQQREQHIQTWLEKGGIAYHRLYAEPFSEWIRARRAFPTIQFPWCAGVLKGLPFNDFLDDVDPYNQATIVMGKTRFDSRSSINLSEYIEASEYFADRNVWHPLYNTDIKNFQRLIHAAGFAVLAQRSLECDPCIYNTPQDFAHSGVTEYQRLKALETELKQSMFAEPIQVPQTAIPPIVAEKKIENYLNQFDGGCGMPYGCGL